MRPDMMRCLYLLLLLCISLPSAAQVADSGRNVVLHADPRLAILLAKRPESSFKGFKGIRGSIHSQRGFRVQIYNGSNRGEAQQRKIDFIRRFPNTRSYMTYIAPTYRVKVGDFKTRADAMRFYSTLSTIYSPCMVVPDIVEINTLRDEE